MGSTPTESSDCSEVEVSSRRRQFLAAGTAAAIGSAGVAGCIEMDSSDNGNGDDGNEDEETGLLATSVTDQPTDIGDFESLEIAIDSIYLSPRRSIEDIAELVITSFNDVFVSDTAESIEVTVTIDNYTMNTVEDAEFTLTISDEDIEPVETRTIDSNTQEEITFSIEADDISSGTYEMEIDANGDATGEATLEVLDSEEEDRVVITRVDDVEIEEEDYADIDVGLIDLRANTDEQVDIELQIDWNGVSEAKSEDNISTTTEETVTFENVPTDDEYEDGFSETGEYEITVMIEEVEETATLSVVEELEGPEEEEGRTEYEFDEEQIVDLTELAGEGETQLIDEDREIPVGRYNYLKLNAEVESATLAENRDTGPSPGNSGGTQGSDDPDVRIPGNAPVTFNKHFEIRSSYRTRFTADMAPIRTGPPSTTRYIIRPVATGIEVTYEEIEENENDEDDEDDDDNNSEE